MKKICIICKNKKILSHFGVRKESKDGRRSECKECRREYYRRFHQKNKSRRNYEARVRRKDNPEIQKGYAKSYRKNNKARYLIALIKIRSEKKGLPFDLDKHEYQIEQRINQGFCELSGIPFYDGDSTKRQYNTPSIDRIDPKLGYVYQNVRVVSFIMNAALGDWGEDVAKNVMKKWVFSK